MKNNNVREIATFVLLNIDKIKIIIIATKTKSKKSNAKFSKKSILLISRLFKLYFLKPIRAPKNAPNNTK